MKTTLHLGKMTDLLCFFPFPDFLSFPLYLFPLRSILLVNQVQSILIASSAPREMGLSHLLS